ncbi:MAG: c-type cytochrome [Campylobacterota bacterium]|nr:c-type cytochrome [Campylobacterota bacterium]
MKTLLMILGITAILGAADGAALYKKCAACHGAQGEKPALGKSAVIGGVDAAAIAADLKGYKAGTTNKKGMGALMKGQMASYSDADIEAVSAYIAGLK